MSHGWNCPDPYEARRQADRDAERDFGYGRSYRHPYDCDEGNDTYRREYHHRFQQMEEERAAERRREERRMEEYREWEWAEQQHAEEAAYYAAMEAQFIADQEALSQQPQNPE